MLVLTRKPGESIVVGNDITITVVEVRGDQVRIGIAAPRSVQVHREEVFRQIVHENTSAAAAAQRTRGLLDRVGDGRLPRRPPRPQRPGPGGGE